jgi:archaetidylinositol phosphate synthase
MNVPFFYVRKLIIGASSGVSYYFGYTVIAVFVLWLSGFLDAVDRTMARET